MSSERSEERIRVETCKCANCACVQFNVETTSAKEWRKTLITCANCGTLLRQVVESN